MLREYGKKRDFSKTSEPPPERNQGQNKAQRAKNAQRFVIQRHAARRLHDDFRLAMEGVLKSWAVPKGIPLVEGEKRLAVHVEDHPLAYAEFEGIIPKGEYGGGTVMLWDIGEYEVGGGDPLNALKEGKLHLWLKGKKLQGEWTLVRTRMEGDDEQWLLMKTGESVTVKNQDRSVLTGRTMEAIAEAQDAEWHSDQKTGSGKSARKKHVSFIAPMKPRLVRALPPGEWESELKFDGYRVIAVKEGVSVKLYSKNEKRLDFPQIADAIARLPCRNGVFDGEIVALDGRGRPSFQLLQNRSRRSPPKMACYLFDLLAFNGEPTIALPLEERRSRLSALLEEAGEPLRYSGVLPGKIDQVLELITAQGLEGVVAKRSGSRYEPGRRSENWVKIKCLNQQEFVIGGYTQPQGSRSHLGALLVGVYAGSELQFAGRVGSGFNERLLRELHARLNAIVVEECPFALIPKTALSLADRKRCQWVRPELVCEVRFTEWTRDGSLRHPVFLGLRGDKAASEVIRENAV